MSIDIPRGTPAGARFHAGERQAQGRWGIADAWDEEGAARLLWTNVPRDYHARIEAAPFFFLATSDTDGNCDCAFKGGGPGVVRILSESRLAFPDFAGNNAFTSLGNMLVNPRVGLLFIDFSDGARLRINGRAEIRDAGRHPDLFPGARRIVVVDIDFAMPLCAAHIPRLVPVEDMELDKRTS